MDRLENLVNELKEDVEFFRDTYISKGIKVEELLNSNFLNRVEKLITYAEIQTK